MDIVHPAHLMYNPAVWRRKQVRSFDSEHLHSLFRQTAKIVLEVDYHLFVLWQDRLGPHLPHVYIVTFLLNLSVIHFVFDEEVASIRVRYSRLLEESCFENRPFDYVYMLLISSFVLLVDLLHS